MDSQQRWFGKNRRASEERRKYDDPHYAGPERRIGLDRRARKRSTLLLVDSSPTFLFYMGMLLKKLEYDVRTTTTAEDALKFMADFTPSLVITDTTLPKMSGVNLVKQMRRDPLLKPIPVIFHTADTNPSVRTACKIEGFAGFFMKPVEPETLYKAIQAATETMPRQMIRIDTALPVEVGNTHIPGQVARQEVITTLSEGGCYIKTLVPEPVNAVVSIKMSIQNREVKSTATVLTSAAKAGGEYKEPGMAVKFLDLSQDDKTLIRNYVKDHILKDLSVPK
jgi:CheY-like chemotaxis protein